jgi:predicted Zn-dependent peptidase
MRNYIAACGAVASSLLILQAHAAEERTEFTLANGLRVRLVAAHEENRVAVILGVRAGFLDEPAGVPHLAHVTEHLTVFDMKGPEERQAVARWYPQRGANGETLADFMYLDLHLAAEELPLALKVQAARFGAMEFSKETLAREIPRTLQEIEFLETSEFGGTGKFALAPFVQAAWHGATDVPLKAKTRGITADQVAAFHRRTFRTDRAILSVVGDFDPKQTRTLIEETFGKLPKVAQPAETRPATKPGEYRVTWDVPTRHLILAWPMPAVENADHPALTAAAMILSQRLFRDQELLKLAKASQVTHTQEGILLVNLQLKPDADAEKAKSHVLGWLERLVKGDGLTTIDLGVARMQVNQLTKPVNFGNTPLPPNVTRTLARANVELQRAMHEVIWGDLPAYVQRLEALQRDGVVAAMTKHLDAKKATIVYIEPKNRP